MRNRFTKIFKLTLLFVLIFVVGLVVCIFFFDQYKPSTSGFSNEYSDSYWSQFTYDDSWTELDGFKRVHTYQPFLNGTDKYDYRSENYEFPWIKDGYSKYGTELTDLERLSFSRYQEEIKKIADPFNTNLTTIKSLITRFETGIPVQNQETAYNSFNNIIKFYTKYEISQVALDDSTDVYSFFNSYGFNGTSYQLYLLLESNYCGDQQLKDQLTEIKTKLEDEGLLKRLASIAYADEKFRSFLAYNSYVSDYASVDYLDGISNTPSYTSIYEYAKNELEVSLSKEDFYYELRNNPDGLFYFDDVIGEPLYTEDDYETVASILYIDEDYRNYLSNYDVEYLTSETVPFKAKSLDPMVNDVFDYNYYELKELLDYYQSLINKRDELTSKLFVWNTFISNDLYGYGGELTSSPNKPVLTKTLNNGNQYQLWFNEYYTTFKLELRDSSNNVLQTWFSNPDESDPNYNLFIDPSNPIDKISNSERDLFRVNYSVFAGAKGKLGSYQYSVSEKNINREVEKLVPDYAFKLDSEKGTFTVWYHLATRGITYRDFPKYLSSERYLELLSRNEVLYKLLTDNTFDYTHLSDAQKKSIGNLSHIEYLLFVDAFKKIEANDPFREFNMEYREFTDYGNKASVTVINTLYTVFYDLLGYSQEELKKDNDSFGVSVDKSDPEFSFAIEYSLNDNGLEVMIPGNSIREDKKFPITTIELLPYFTQTVKGIGGYTVIPDGSGAIMNHDNNKQNYTAYSKRVYTTDLSDVKEINPGKTEDLMFPMYAVINNNNSGILCYSLDNGSQLSLFADVSNRGLNDDFNENYYTVYLRESGVVTTGTTTYTRQNLTKWTNKMITRDVKINFRILDTQELSYSEAAKVYREILQEHYQFDDKDITNNPTLDMSIIGTYSYDDNFIGIPYTAKDTLTTVDETNKILDAYLALGVKNINTFYYGWRKNNLTNDSFRSIRLSSLIGSKSKFESLLKGRENVTVYPYVSFGELNNYQESFGDYHYTSHSIAGEFAIRQEYELNTNLFNKKAPKISALSPRYYYKFATLLTNNYSKLLKNANTLAIESLGYRLSGEYKKGMETFKGDAIAEQIKSLDYITSNGINNLTLYTPYDYAFKYTNVARKVPFNCTGYEILDYSIPFYQLVANGVFDYSGLDFNAVSEMGANQYLMHLLETGSNMAYTFTYDSSEKLLQTDYNTYYYTLYKNWFKDVETMNEELTNLGIYDGRLVSHEKVSNEVYKVTYKTTSGSDIVIYLNYTRNNYTTPDGIVIPHMSYKKI